MKKIVLPLLFFCSVAVAVAQQRGVQKMPGIILDTLTTAELNALPNVVKIKGAYFHNKDLGGLVSWNGSTWELITGGTNLNFSGGISEDNGNVTLDNEFTAAEKTKLAGIPSDATNYDGSDAVKLTGDQDVYGNKDFIGYTSLGAAQFGNVQFSPNSFDLHINGGVDNSTVYTFNNTRELLTDGSIVVKEHLDAAISETNNNVVKLTGDQSKKGQLELVRPYSNEGDSVRVKFNLSEPTTFMEISRDSVNLGGVTENYAPKLKLQVDSARFGFSATDVYSGQDLDNIWFFERPDIANGGYDASVQIPNSVSARQYLLQGPVGSFYSLNSDQKLQLGLLNDTINVVEYDFLDKKWGINALNGVYMEHLAGNGNGVVAVDNDGNLTWAANGGGGSADGVISNVERSGTDLNFTGTGGGFNGSVDLSGVGSGIQEVNTTTDLYSISTPTTGQRAIVTGGIEDEVFIYDATQSGTNNGATVFDGWVRQFDGVYLKPQWFGAAMDGVTDDRDAFVNTIAYADTLVLKVGIDRDMFLDVEETGVKSIFLPSNCHIKGFKDAKLIYNNLLSPAFYIALSDNVTITDLHLEYDNSYDATYGANTAGYSDDFLINLQQLRNYMRDYKGVTFNGIFPVDRGFVSFYATFLIEGSQNIRFENLKVTAKGDNANQFVREFVKMKEQYPENSTVNSTSDPKRQVKNVFVKNIEIDGYLMGFQGLVDGFEMQDVNAYRWSDMQASDGSAMGGWDGTNHNFPPPHLIYLNRDLSTEHNTKNVVIKNTHDHGLYTGSNNLRQTTGENIGYCGSLKLVDDIENVVVDNYKSFRRDGLADLGSIVNGYFNNLYSEGQQGVFDQSMKYVSLRFLGDMDTVIFNNITVIDNSTQNLENFPVSFNSGNNVTYNNFQVKVKNISVTGIGFFGISGDNNKIINSGLTIENHTATDLRRPLIFHDDITRNTGANNHYEITVKGWRNIDSDPVGLSPRMLFASAINPNNNYARVHDVSNNMVIEQQNNNITQTWLKRELVTLGSGTSQQLAMNIPRYYRVKKVTANTTTATASGNINIGTSANGSDLLRGVSNTTGIVESLEVELNPNLTGNRNVYISTDTDFASTGVVMVTLELERIATENGAFGTDFKESSDYNNSLSGLAATNVQDALDEIAASSTATTGSQYYPTTVTSKKTLTDADFSAAANYKSQLFNITSDTLELGDGVTSANYNKALMVIPSSSSDNAYIKPVDGDTFRVLGTNTAFTADGIVLTGNEVATIFKTDANTWIVSASSYTEFNEVTYLYQGNNAADPNNEVNGIANIDIDANSSISSSIEQVQNGTYSVKVEKTTSAANNIHLSVSGLTIGQNYTVSAYVYRVDNGGNLDMILDDFENWQATVSDRNDFDNSGVWDLLTVTGQATSTTARIRFNQTSTTTPKTWYLDNVTVTQQ